ncbi:hypothetical protein ACYZT8_11200 [Pseudomonas sp. LB3P93]
MEAICYFFWRATKREPKEIALIGSESITHDRRVGTLVKNLDGRKINPMKTTFETALDQHEISDFFKGNGIYFARGSDWGDHLYVGNWAGMCSILETQKAAQGLLTTIFEEYARHLNENYEDAEGLLSNITAYYITRQKYPFLSADNYDLIKSLDNKSKENIGRLFRLLRKEHDKITKDLQMLSFEQRLQKLKSNDCTIDLESL